MKANKLIPRVLIGTPVSDRHKNLIDEWIAHLDSLTYPIDVCLIDTTLNSNNYYNKLKKMKVQDRKITVMRHVWNPDEWHPIQMLAHAREKIRQYFLKESYDYLFWLDDDIFIPKNGVQRLLSYNKDHIGFYVHVFYKPKRVPCILKSGEIIMGQGLEYYSFKEINAYKKFIKNMMFNKLSKEERGLIPFIVKDKGHPQLFKAYGVGIGCLMVSKKAMETVPFRTHKTFIYGEDLWYFAEANEKGFEFWCDSNVRAIHKNTEWDTVIRQSKKQMQFFVAQGPSDAKQAVIVDRSIK